MKGLFYHYSPAADVGHGVHLYRLADALFRRLRGRAGLTLLRDGDSPYPPLSSWKYGPALRAPASPAARAALLRRAAGGSDFVVTAFFPLGRTGCAPALLPALGAARAGGTRIYCSAALPYVSWPERELDRLYAAAALYDRIFVHCPPGFDLKYMARAVAAERRISAAAFLGAFRGLGAKVSFTGYVLPREMPAPRPGRRILVHRGGGSTSPGIITAALKARPLLASGLPLTVVAGPASTAAELRRWRRLAGPGTELLKDTDDLPRLMADSAVVAGTAGGTVYEALKLRRRCVLVPYLGRPGAEHSDQAARAAMMRDLAGARVLDYAALTPARFAAAVDAALAGPPPAFRPAGKMFAGAAATAAAIREDLCSGK